MFNKILLTALFAFANAGSLTLTFRGLDSEYLLRPFSLSTLREVISCHTSAPYSSVTIDSITYMNVTANINQFDPVYPIKCIVSNNVRFNSQWLPGTGDLIKQLQAEEPIHITISIPDTVNTASISGANILEFIITCFDEKYANVLMFDYTYFYKDSMKILNSHSIVPFNGILGDSEYKILGLMFAVQMIVIILGNYILGRMKTIKIPSSMNNNDKIHVFVK